jgi:hypothetical protein
MTRKFGYLAVFAVVVAPLMAAQVSAQTTQGAPAASACPPGAQYVPAGRDGAGNPVAAYCASAPIGRSTSDPYTGGGAADPSASQSGGPGQVIPPSR